MVLFEHLKTVIPSKERYTSTGARYIDRFCEVVPAGFDKERKHEGMKECLEHLVRSPTPEPVKKINRWTNPEVESKRIFHAFLNDEVLKQAQNIRHGIQSKESDGIKEILRPKDASAMTNLMQTFNEQVYISSTKKRLGQTPVSHLPPSVDPYKTTFGIKNKPGEGAGPLINPRVSRVEVLNSDIADREHYLISHKHLFPGEQGRRRYDNFDIHQTFGVPTQCDPRGIHVRNALNWCPKIQCINRTSTISDRQFDFNERYGHKLGKTRDPISDTMAVSGDHTFGLPSKQGELTAAELICGTIPRQLAGLPNDDDDATVTRTNSENGCVNFQQRVDCLMPVVHHTLRNASFSRGSDITAALCHLSNGEDLISMVDARELLLHFEVPLDEELTEQIFDLVMVEAPDKIMENAMKKAETSRLENQIVFKSRSNEDAFRWAVDWRLLAAFLDWKRNPIERERLRECGCQETLNAKSDKNEVAEAVKRRIRRAIDANVKTYILSSEQYSGDRDGLLNPECWARLGSQSVRRKVPVPKVKRTLDYTNYGDETTIRSLLQPSIYAEYGLSSHDLLLPRTKQELRSIMDKCGLTEKYNLGNKFDQIWSKSLQLDKVVGKDTVSEDGSTASLHAFREALLEDRAEEIRKQFDVYYSNLCC